MKKILLDGLNKKFYKANMHCHSTISDGMHTPVELKQLYKEKGYSILAITDHENIVSHSELDDEDFLTITGAEYAIKEFPKQSTLKNRRMKVCHLNLYAKKQNNTNCICYSSVLDHFTKDPLEKARLIEKYGNYNRIYGTEGINEIIRLANENGFFVCYNHPRWSLENYGDYSGYEGLWGVEVYNNGCNINGLYEYDINVFDDFLRDGKKIYASCGDDNHSFNELFGTFVMVNTDTLLYENVINALLSGNFYGSTGPEIYEMYVEDFVVHIKCSAVKRIAFSTQGRRTLCKTARDTNYINEAEFEISPDDGYFRIEICDKNGNRGWTQPYYVEDLL